ncbi:DNA polymerase I, partial [Bacillus cereus]|nr:DNA polymerase I [Bacillus cereus]
LDAMHLLNEHEESYGLKKLVEKYGKYFGILGPIYTFEDMFGNGSPAPFSVELVGIYAIKDVLYGWKLFEWQVEMMRKSPGRLLECYAKIDSKLPEVDVFMARCGFEIDLGGLKELEAEFVPALEQAKRDVIETYGIDDEFVRKMDRTLSVTKINKWIEAQRARIKRWEDSVRRQQKIVNECETAGKTGLKTYRDATEKLRKLYAHAPRYVTEFSITNGNHLKYLIYDHLGI